MFENFEEKLLVLSKIQILKIMTSF